MREIKFRAWDKTNKKMLILQPIRTMVSEDCFVLPVYEGLSHDGIENYELMQYTGLKDKNGKEIYEGDVVKTFWQHDGVECHDYELTGEIVWNKEDACFSLDCSDQTIRFITTYEREELIDIEVIGNIYENPELLNTK
jgi:uncharacterized phage protein (TIGR01671 family)